MNQTPQKRHHDFPGMLRRLSEGQTLSATEAAQAFGDIITGAVSKSLIAIFLWELAVRTPTVEEVTGAARAMRYFMRSLNAPFGTIDICGTGGDGLNTLNVSTAAAFVVAACGVPVAKHGNRSSLRDATHAGSADVLEALGINIHLKPEDAAPALHRSNFCFLFAPHYHVASAHVAQVRHELGFRTIFNLLGPICNPANVKRQLIGVSSVEWAYPLALVLRELGTEKAWVVHGADGLDELSTTGNSLVYVLDDDKIAHHDVIPEDIGIERTSLDALKGGSASENAAAIRRVLKGEKNAFADIVILNAAAALIVAGKAVDLKAGAALAREAIGSGKAKQVLDGVTQGSQIKTEIEL